MPTMSNKTAERFVTDVMSGNDTKLIPVGLVLLGAIRVAIDNSGRLTLLENASVSPRLIEHDQRSPDEKKALQFINKYAGDHNGEYPSTGVIKRTIHCSSYLARKYKRVAAQLKAA